MNGATGSFKELVESTRETGLFVDKTLMIREIIQSRVPLLITRPRRWGKTLNLSMLFFFFVHREQLRAMGRDEAYIQQCDQLFRGLNICNPQLNPDLQSTIQHQGQYPTLFISFTNNKGLDNSGGPETDWSQIKNSIIQKISKVFQEYAYLLTELNVQIQKKKLEEQEERLKEQEEKRLKEQEKRLRAYEHQIQEYLRITGKKEVPDTIASQLYSQIVLPPSDSRPDNLLADYGLFESHPAEGLVSLMQDAALFSRLLRGEPKDELELTDSIYFLVQLLQRRYQKPVIILIDEYDHLWNQAYQNDALLSHLTRTFAGLFSPFTKPSEVMGSEQIQKVVFTGVLRISKASIFSGMNNLTECTIFDPTLSAYYGFTQAELEHLLTQANLLDQKNNVMAWYNGYFMGKETIYNPWSIMQFINLKVLKPYWIHTANHQFLKTLILSNKGTPTNQLLKELIQNGRDKTLLVEARQHLSIEDLRNPDQIWSFLLHTGYLTAVSCNFDPDRGSFSCQVRIPNIEVNSIYQSIIQDWLKENPPINQLVEAAFAKNYSEFIESLHLLLKSKYDTALFARQSDSLEEVYHSFLLFELNQKTRQSRYALLPEQPTGLGKADILLIDHLGKQILPIEIKRTGAKSELLKTAQDALTQAQKKKYGTLTPYRSYQILPAIGIAFCAKLIAMKVQGLKKVYRAS